MGERLSEKQKEFLRKKSKEDLYFFAKGILGFDWLTPGIHKPLCRLLQGEKTRICIVLPRGWLKTTICSCAFPLWLAIRNPNIRILLAQNTYKNAVAKFNRIKGVVSSNELFRVLFYDILPGKNSKWREDSLCLSRSKEFDESTFEAAGTRTQLTSRHYDVIIEDDTVAPELEDVTLGNAIPSKEDIERAIGWHRLVTPLLNDPLRSRRIVVGTRWAEMDLLSWIKENEQYEFYERAVKEDEAGNPFEDGKISYPERFSQEVLDDLKRTLGPYLYSALYMNQPLRGSEMQFKPEWIKYHDGNIPGLVCYTTIDLAGDPKESKGTPDYNVVMTCGKDLTTSKIYVLEYARKRTTPGEVIDDLFDQVKKYHPIKVGLESVAYQKSLSYWIKERMSEENEYFHIENITHGKRSKFVRISGLQPVFARGDIYILPQHTELVEELLAFPLGVNDDIIDTLSMQLPMWDLTQHKDQEELERKEGYTLQDAIDEMTKRNQKEYPYDVLPVGV